MKYSTRLSGAAHMLVIVALSEDGGATSTTIAESLSTNPSYVRHILSKLKACGLADCSQGRTGIALARPADEISLLDIYRAVEGDKPLLHLSTSVNPDCAIGVNVQYALGDCYRHVQDAAEAVMAKIALQDVIDDYEKRAAGWSGEKAR